MCVCTVEKASLCVCTVEYVWLCVCTVEKVWLCVCTVENPFSGRWEGAETDVDGVRCCHEKQWVSVYCTVLWSTVQRGKTYFIGLLLDGSIMVKQYGHYKVRLSDLEPGIRNIY